MVLLRELLTDEEIATLRQYDHSYFHPDVVLEKKVAELTISELNWLGHLLLFRENEPFPTGALRELWDRAFKQTKFIF